MNNTQQINASSAVVETASSTKKYKAKEYPESGCTDGFLYCQGRHGIYWMPSFFYQW